MAGKVLSQSCLSRVGKRATQRVEFVASIYDTTPPYLGNRGVNVGREAGVPHQVVTTDCLIVGFCVCQCTLCWLKVEHARLWLHLVVQCVCEMGAEWGLTSEYCLTSTQ